MRKIKIIAEMAWSHDGSYKKASKLIKAAKNLEQIILVFI